MGYVVANIDTAKILTRSKTERGAKISKSRKYKDQEHIQVFEYNFFDEFIDVEVEVINLISGKPVTIRKSQAGGCTDPSTERFWSM